ncbi:DUF927 domain-containing protein [Paraburkholderia sp. MM6662-R1]|uniref:DUF927 domain-containing protein n=1 Tax=Paraburkholderia sp. MM6662-R1 TaxID=2991066 RepID=UPI003D1BED58
MPLPLVKKHLSVHARHERIHATTQQTLNAAAGKTASDAYAASSIAPAENENLPEVVPFVSTPEGLFEMIGGRREHVCSPMRWLGQVFDPDGGNPAHALEIETRLSTIKRVEIPETLLTQPADLARFLIAQGVQLAPTEDSTRRIARYLRSIPPGQQYVRAYTDGWLTLEKQSGYVFGDEWFSPTSASLAVMRSSRDIQQRSSRGNLDDWLEITKWCAHNPLLIAGLSFACASALVEPLHHDTFSVAFVGRSSSGKTTLLRFLQALLSAPNDVATWEGTANGLAARAARCKDQPTILDEIGQADVSVLDSATYGLTNGQGKSRATPEGGLAANSRISTVIVTAGEESTRERLVSGGLKPKLGQIARFITLPVDQEHGAFSNLHGARDGAEFADRMKSAFHHTHGVAWRHFVKYVAENLETLKSAFKRDAPRIRSALVTNLEIDTSDGVFMRVLDHFVVATFAGRITPTAGICALTEREIGIEMRECFEKWFSEYSATRTSAGSLMIDRVLALLQKRQKQIYPFVEYNKCEAQEPFAYRYAPANGREALLLVRPEAFDLLKEKYGVREFHDTLQASGWIEPGSGGKPTKQFKVPGGSGMRFRAYAFRESFLSNTM